MPDLLIELFSEEIPARMQTRAAEDLRKLVTDGLVEAGLTYAHARSFSTPRRLVLALEGMSAESPTRREERKGPKVGAPEKAIDGFLRSTGLTIEQLETRDDKKGAVYFAVVEHPGRPAAEIVAEVLEKTIRTFPWPKSMRWGSGSLRWVRPLHAILCVMSDEGGAQVVPLSVDGIDAGNVTYGHRFMAPAPFQVSGFEDYAAKLRQSYVVLDAQDRAEAILNEVKNQAFALGLDLVEDPGLLAEVAGLVEWPVVLVGRIDDDFLGLPPEVLQTSMREHQKFFSLRDPATGQIVRFVTVANRETADNGATILAGNQKVLAARLSDAKFFWENDLRTVANVGLSGMAEGLANVTFHNKLGSQKARIDRICALAREIAPLVGASPDLAHEAAEVAKADLQSAMGGEFPELQGTMGVYYAKAAGLPDVVANACKAHYQPLGPSDDVPTDPVSVAVALADKIDTLTGFWAIDEKPTGSKDPFALRRAALGVIRLVLGNGVRINVLKTAKISYAIHVVEGQFVYGPAFQKTVFTGELWELPTSVDGIPEAPFELLLSQGEFNSELWNDIVLLSVGDNVQFEQDAPERFERAETASLDLRVRAKNLYELSFEKLREISEPNWISKAISAGVGKSLWSSAGAILAADLLAFFHDRLKVHLREQGIRHDVIDACLAMPQNDDLTLLVNRAQALSALMKSEDGENLLQGFKRANNILTQAEDKDGVEYSFGADPKFAETDAERALFAALDAADEKIAPAMDKEDFTAAMHAMAQLRAPIDAFFDAVQINTDSEILRRNRLNLLHRIRATCLRVADLTKLDG